MEEEQAAGCTRPTAASAVENTSSTEIIVEQQDSTTKEQSMVHVGEKAPDFTAPGYHNGQFLNGVKLSDYAGKWLLLCFYPGDFTFV